MTGGDALIDELTGYTDRLSVRPGERVRVHAAGQGAGTVGLVRLRGVVRENRHGFEAEGVDDAEIVNVAFAARPVRHGSYAALPSPWEPHRGGDREGVDELSLFVRPSWAGAADVSRPLSATDVVAAWGWMGRQLVLRVSGDGYALETGDGMAVATAGVTDREPTAWHRIRVHHHVTGEGAVVRLEVDGTASQEAVLPAASREADTAIILGARSPEGPGAFDGQIARVVCTRHTPAGPDVLASWDLGVGDRNDTVRDRSPRSLHGHVIGIPDRGAPGPMWGRREVDPRLAPEEFDAAHFHHDDLADIGWPVTAELTVPDGLPAGVYAAELRAGESVDWIPFVVRSPRGSTSAGGRVGFLLSSFTYQAYANASLGERIDYKASGISGRDYLPGDRDAQIARHQIVAGSLYDVHRDGSGRRFSSRLRPIFNFRPDFTSAVQQAPRHLGADLYLLEWLQSLPYEVEVLTDHDLHREGYEAVRHLRAVVSSSHPEYVSTEILDALTAHQQAGGSFLYLGGNGFYWVTSTTDPEGTSIECRRGNAATRTWDSAAGETYHFSTGEPGGLWRHRGRSPNRLVGIGMASQGFDEKAQAFRTTPALLEQHPDLAFLLEGMRDPERFGEHGLVMDGAAGDELDRWDPDLGSPVEAVVVATSERHSKHYMLVHEDILMSEIRLGADVNDKVRSDIIWWPTPAGGYVFSVGSISWAGAMAYDGFDNDCTVLVTNALGRIMAERAGR